MKELSDLLIPALFFIPVLPGRIFAYLDPGSGSYVFQIVIAAFLSLLLTLKTLRKNPLEYIKNLLKAKTKRNEHVKK